MKLDTNNTLDILEIEQKRRRSLGEHLTSIDIFNKFILPQIKSFIYDYCWVDLFCGEGNLILPILNKIPASKRVEFFKKHIYLFDIQEQMVKKSIANAEEYGIPPNIACQNIKSQDTLKEYPKFIKSTSYPVFHITNPPYLYIGYIVKHSNGETKKALTYFQKENEGLQDLYQIALMNDLRNGLRDMIYIIPSNFLFGFSVSNKFRNVFLPFYTIKSAFIFEEKIFEFTGTNVCICHFQRKPYPAKEPITFEATKFNTTVYKRRYTLKPENHYRAGDEFEDFVNIYKCSKPLEICYYLTQEEIDQNKGQLSIEVIDSNKYINNEYFKFKININEKLFRKISDNSLFIRTVDTGSKDGRIGLFYIKDVHKVSGVVVTKAKYRTHPIQIFLYPPLKNDDIELLKDYFNLILEYFREFTDSEFLTTYKYSDSSYIRKYLGLSQTKRLLETFPINVVTEKEKKILKELVNKKDSEGVLKFIKGMNSAYI